MARPEEMPVRVCPYCGTVYIEDDHMYEDVNRCPHCGRQVVHDLGPGDDSTV
jgi:DNA-directed RNA polymerase subunit RPC12/RpoP